MPFSPSRPLSVGASGQAVRPSCHAELTRRAGHRPSASNTERPPYRRISYRELPRQAMPPSCPSDPTTRSAPHASTNPNRRHGAAPLVRPCRCHSPPPRLNDPPRGCQLPVHATIRLGACLWHNPPGMVQMTLPHARVLGCIQCVAPSALHRDYRAALALASRSTNYDGVES